MKRLFLLLTIILVFGILSAQETYRFSTDTPQGFSIKTSTASGLSLHYAVNEIGIANIDNGEDKGQEIIMKGSFGSFAEGLPNLPFENRYVAVPHGATVSVTVKENGNTTFHDINLLPAAEVMENNALALPKLRRDMDVFGKDADFPTKNVTIAQTTQIRGLDVVLLSVTPFRYNPIRRTLDIIYDMDIEVRFEGGNGQFGEARYRNPAWDNILRDLVINSDMLPEAHYYEQILDAIRNDEEGCEYLIISPDDPAILAWADTLKQFRMRQGILTKVITTTDCGGNEPENIRNFILNAYENWSIPPAAVLLFAENHSGAPEFGLKPYVFTSPPSYGHVYLYPSDNPFADMNSDSIPDLAISRFVTKYPSEYKQQVKKVIDYELNPPTDPHYYDHPIITSGYQEDKWFMITSQSVNGFFCDKLGKHATNNYMVFDQQDPNPTPPDSIWSTGYNTNAVIDYFGPHGTQYIPSNLSHLDHWDKMTDIQPLVDAMNEGGFLTFHRDHSSEDLWCCPWFEAKDIPLLQNETPTFIFAIGCLNNDFWDNWTTCLSESFLKAEPGGAIGAIGANSVTFSHFNDLITWGMFDYFWPDFMPTLGSQTEPIFSYPSYSLVAGKLFLRQQTFLPYASDAEKVDKTLNLFSFLGETYLNLYTEVPQPLFVEASPYHANDQWHYEFTAEEGSLVCFSKDNEIFEVVQGTGHNQCVTLPEMAIGEQFVITATKRNRFRYQQMVEIIPSAQSYIHVKNTVFNDQNGNGQLDYGESASIDFQLHNAGQIASQGCSLQLLCDSPYVEILQGNATYPNIEPDAVYNLHNAFQIKVTNDVPDQTRLSFYVQFNEDQNTHSDATIAIANAPDLYIEPGFRLTTTDGEPSTHIATEGRSKITFTVGNKGHLSSKILNASLEIKAPFVEVENPQIQLESLAPNETLSFTFELNSTPNAITGAWLQSHLTLQHLEQFIELDTIIQYGGIFESFETDTLNPLCQWANTGGHRWIYSDEDAYEGRRCFISQADTLSPSRLNCKPKAPYVTHDCKISFRYKTDDEGQLHLKYGYNSIYLTSKEWHYAEFAVGNSNVTISFIYTQNDNNSVQAKLDDIWFPPIHTTIACAGDDIVACGETPVALYKAYAYDCDVLLWATDGDGHFENDTVVNTLYYPGNQDIAKGNVALTLTAYGNDTVISTTQIRFADEVGLGEIVGDSVVNKYNDPISHYSVDNPEGLPIMWMLSPADAGAIYGYGDAINILWNPNESDLEATLWATSENGCTPEPSVKHISLIGYSTPEWHSVDFDLFPNPTEGKVNLIIGETIQGKAVIEVYNLLGERMLTKTVYRLQRNENVSLDMSRLVSGLYIIKLNTENGSCSKKVSVR